MKLVATERLPYLAKDCELGSNLQNVSITTEQAIRAGFLKEVKEELPRLKVGDPYVYMFISGELAFRKVINVSVQDGKYNFDGFSLTSNNIRVPTPTELETYYAKK